MERKFSLSDKKQEGKWQAEAKNWAALPVLFDLPSLFKYNR